MKTVKLNNNETLELKSEKNHCNFCGDLGKDCVKANFPCKFYSIQLRNKKELEWLSKGFFSKKELYWVLTSKNEDLYEMKTDEMFAYICYDCIKQINKLI